MIARAFPVASTSNWLATFAYAYFVFIASTRLVTTGLRWAAATVSGSVAYVLLMLVFAGIWQRDPSHAAAWCGAAMALAVPLAAWVTTLLLKPSQRRAGVWVCTALAMLYPMLLAAGSEPGAPVRAMQYLYVAATGAGGIAAMALISRPPTRSQRAAG